MTTHVLKGATSEVPCEGLQGDLKKFWEKESLSIKTPSIREEFFEKVNRISRGRLHFHHSLTITS